MLKGNKYMECFVYWIHLEEQKDISTEGYVGISNNPEYRFYQHKHNATNEKQHKRYRTDFRNALENNLCLLDIILCGTRECCMEVEAELRPEWVVGWNIAAGGSGGFGKHGLTGSRIQKTYYNLLTRAKNYSENICKDWLPPEGILKFKDWLDEVENISGELTFLVKGAGCNPSNVGFLSKEEISNRSKRTKLYCGNFYSVKELAKEFDIDDPNKISSRLTRGWTVDEAIGLQKRQGRQYFNGAEYVSYSGKLTDNQLDILKLCCEQGCSFKEMAKRMNINENSGHLSYLIKKLGFVRTRLMVTDFLGGEFPVPDMRVLSLKDYEEIKNLLLKGDKKYSIADKFGISPSTMTDVCKRLKWREYLDGKKDVG